MAYSRYKYNLGVVPTLSNECTEIKSIYCESLTKFMEKLNFGKFQSDFYLLRKEKLVMILCKFKNGSCLVINLLEDTKEIENSILVKDMIFFIGDE